MPKSRRTAAPASRMAAGIGAAALRTAAERRAHAEELFERALLAHQRARNSLLRATGLLRQAQRYLEEEPPMPVFPPVLDWPR